MANQMTFAQKYEINEGVLKPSYTHSMFWVSYLIKVEEENVFTSV